MMMVIMSMVVMMVRAMIRGMRMLTTISRQAQGCQIYICPWQPVQNMISLVTWPRPSLGKTRIAFYFSYNFSPLSTNTFLV